MQKKLPFTFIWKQTLVSYSLVPNLTLGGLCGFGIGLVLWID